MTLLHWLYAQVWPNLVASMIWGPAVIAGSHLIHRRWHAPQIEALHQRLDALTGHSNSDEAE